MPTSTKPAKTTTLDARTIRVLAHPMRVRLLSRLRQYGPATATMMAEALDTNTGATSYHLRKLAEVGLVEETGEGQGRERWWQSVYEIHSFHPSTVADDPDARAAAGWLMDFHLRTFNERAARWARERERAPIEWQDEGSASDYLLHLNADQLHDLHLELHDVVERYRVLESGPGARPVVLFLHAIPDNGGTW